MKKPIFGKTKAITLLKLYFQTGWQTVLYGNSHFKQVLSSIHSVITTTEETPLQHRQNNRKGIHQNPHLKHLFSKHLQYELGLLLQRGFFFKFWLPQKTIYF